MKGVARVLTVMAVAAGCSQPAPARVNNTCDSDADCYRARCELDMGICVTDVAEVPYPVRILVSDLPGGEGLVDRFAFPPFDLDGREGTPRLDRHDLDVPLGVRIRGKVIGTSSPINAEFAFTPLVDVAENERVESVVTESHGYTAATEDNLVVDLAADTKYDVRIIPLGSVSERFPPRYTQLDTSTTRELAIDYGQLEEREGVLTDEAGRRQEGKNVRLTRRRDSVDPTDEAPPPEVLSVTDTVTADGSFVLRAPPEVLVARQYVLQIDLDSTNPWQTTIELDPTRVDSGAKDTIIIPVVPKRVTFKGKVEKGAAPIAAELTFISNFEIPDTAGDLHDRDWCRSSVPEDTRPQPRCKTTVRTVTDSVGEFAVDLLPGDYKLYISPGTAPNSPRTAQISVEDVIVETQPNDRPQQGQVFKVRSNYRYRGNVRNEAGEPVAGVVVRAIALQRKGLLDDEAALNRSAESATDSNGRFELGLDLGYYDLVARAGDGFPWVYVTNLAVSKDDEVPGFVIPAPVVVSGYVRNAGVEAINASIEAYAEVISLSGKRLVLLGRTTSNDQGKYTLTLPPKIFEASSSSR